MITRINIFLVGWLWLSYMNTIGSNSPERFKQPSELTKERLLTDPEAVNEVFGR